MPQSLALGPPACPAAVAGPALRGELTDIVPTLAKAYVEGNALGLQAYADSEGVSAHTSNPDTVTVGSVRSCAMWGNDRLAFAWANASYDARSTIGQTLVLLVLRKPASQWQLLVAARDPISNGEFVNQAQSLAALLTNESQPGALPAPRTSSRIVRAECYRT